MKNDVDVEVEQVRQIIYDKSRIRDIEFYGKNTYNGLEHVNTESKYTLKEVFRLLFNNKQLVSTGDFIQEDEITVDFVIYGREGKDRVFAYLSIAYLNHILSRSSRSELALKRVLNNDFDSYFDFIRRTDIEGLYTLLNI